MYSAGYAGHNILGTGYDLEIIVHAGAGAYICGEETALLDSLEGQPHLRPPFPAIAGLYASPTVINNVESIASVPSIIANGADWFSSMGTEKSRGMTIYSFLVTLRTPDSSRHRWASRCASFSILQAASARAISSSSGHRAAPRRRCSPTPTSTYHSTTRRSRA